MSNTTKKRKSFRAKTKIRKPKKRFVGKPGGQIQQRVKDAGPEHFVVVAVDSAKRRSKWMLMDFYGRVLIEPTVVEHTAGHLRAMTQTVTATANEHGLTDIIVAVEMTGIYHKPVQCAFRKAGFDTRIVHPFASKHFQKPLHPDNKTDDNDLEAIFHAAINGYGLATLPVSESYQSLQSLSRHRHNLVKQRSRLMVQIRRLIWAQLKVDPRDRRCRIANRAMRMVYQIVAGRQVWRGKGVNREYMLEKIRQFHLDHHSPLEQICKDLHEAFVWMPKSIHAEEARPLVEVARKKRRGLVSIGELLVPLLIRLGVRLEELPGVACEEIVKSNTSEARSSD